tara:strand:- start:9665 stop:10585 length:921 start_codon:yes stop_codon:yes gene_type:complete
MKKYYLPKFWDKKFNLISFFLIPLSFIYLFLILLNKLKIIFARTYNIKVICVGNIYLGGTGKTPLVSKIYNELNINKSCCILKKFYKNQRDEINFLKNRAEIFVPKKRCEGLLNAMSKGFEYVILDDGMQDYSFKKNKSILCIKSNKAFGNERILPAGPLREPLSSIKNYQLSVINGNKNEYIEKLLKKYNPSIKIFYSHYEIKNIENFLNKKFFVFSGIADNQSFFDILNKNKIEVHYQKEFKDHHNFTDDDIEKILKICKSQNIDLLTTEKNFYGLKEKFKDKVQYIKLDLIIKNFEGFINEII